MNITAKVIGERTSRNIDLTGKKIYGFRIVGEILILKFLGETDLKLTGSAKEIDSILKELKLKKGGENGKAN